jgi:hypothetical protein
MENKNKLITLWLLTIIGMILHFNYHIGGIFYGVDVVKPGYDGQEPLGVLIIRNTFYHLPILWILVILYAQKEWVKKGLFVLSVLYLLAHTAHFTGEVLNPEKNPSQISLLFVVLVVAATLAFEHFKTIRKKA